MKKLIFILLVISMITCMFVSCNKNNNSQSINNNNSRILEGGDLDHYYWFYAKIIEIKDNNILFVEVSDKFKTAYETGDKVYVKYNDAKIEDEDETEIADYKPAVGDEVMIRYFPTGESSQMDGYDYHECYGAVIKRIYTNSSSQAESK